MGQTRKIILCGMGLPGRNPTYTPLDLARVKDIMITSNPSADIEMIQLALHKRDKSAYKDNLKTAALNLVKKNPRMIIFFLDNILCSMFYYEGAFEKLANEIKVISPKITIGVQSSKLDKNGESEILNRSPSISFVIGKIANRKKRSDWKLYSKGLLDKFITPDSLVMLLTKEGCTNRCKYCFRGIKHETISYSPVLESIQELKYLFKRGVKNIFIIDDNFIADGKYLDSFAYHYRKAFKKTGPELHIMARPEQLSPRNILTLKKINTAFVQVGIQSINKDLDWIYDRKISQEQIKKNILNLKKAGIKKVWTDLIIGLPGDDYTHFRRSIKFCLSLKPYAVQVKQLYMNPLTPFKRDQNRLELSVSKKKDDFRVPFVTGNKTYSPKDIKKSFQYCLHMAKKKPEIKWKIVSQFGTLNTHENG